jgi:hypothetical protein
MVRVELRGIAKTKAKGRTYYYAWRGGPRLRGEPGSPEFHLSYNEAIESRRTPEPGRFRSLVVLYREAPTMPSSQIRLGRSGRHGWIAFPTILATFALRNSIDRKRSDQPYVDGAAGGPTSRALPTMPCSSIPRPRARGGGGQHCGQSVRGD